jgi:hypothetical protein
VLDAAANPFQADAYCLWWQQCTLAPIEDKICEQSYWFLRRAKLLQR